VGGGPKPSSRSTASRCAATPSGRTSRPRGRSTG
jgi:hypothetical protein